MFRKASNQKKITKAIKETMALSASTLLAASMLPINAFASLYSDNIENKETSDTQYVENEIEYIEPNQLTDLLSKNNDIDFSFESNSSVNTVTDLIQDDTAITNIELDDTPFYLVPFASLARAMSGNDNSNEFIESASLKWRQTTGESYFSLSNDDKNLLYQSLSDNAFSLHIEFSAQLKNDNMLPVGAFSLSIPKDILKDRDEKAIGKISFSVPQAPNNTGAYAYSEMENCYIITNTRELPVRARPWIQFSLNDITPHELCGDGTSIISDLQADLMVVDNNGIPFSTSTNGIEAKFKTDESAQAVYTKYSSLSTTWRDWFPDEWLEENKRDSYVYMTFYSYGIPVGNQRYNAFLNTTVSIENAETGDLPVILGYSTLSGNIIPGTWGSNSATKSAQIASNQYSQSGRTSLYSYTYVAIPKRACPPANNASNQKTYNITLTNELSIEGVNNKTAKPPISVTAIREYTPTDSDSSGSHFSLFVNGNNTYPIALNQLEKNKKVLADFDIHVSGFGRAYTKSGNEYNKNSYKMITVPEKPVLSNSTTDNGDITVSSVSFESPSFYKWEQSENQTYGYGTNPEEGEHHVSPGDWAYIQKSSGTATMSLYEADSTNDIVPAYKLAQIVYSNGSFDENESTISNPNKVAEISDGKIQLKDGVSNVIIVTETKEDACSHLATITYSINPTTNICQQAQQSIADDSASDRVLLLRGDMYVQQNQGSITRIPTSSSFNTTKDFLGGMRVTIRPSITSDIDEETYKADKTVKVSYNACVTEQTNLSTMKELSYAQQNECFSQDTKAVWRVLLPKNGVIDKSSINLREKDSLDSMSIIPNFGNSDRDMLVIETKLTPQYEYIQYGMGQTGLADSPQLSFDVLCSWYDIEYYGTTADSVLAYESYCEEFGTTAGGKSEKDSPSGIYNDNGVTENITSLSVATHLEQLGYPTLFDDLSNNENTSFVYAFAAPELNNDKYGADGIAKTVKTDNHYTLNGNVVETGLYTYRISNSSFNSSSAANFVLYDILDSADGSEWAGTVHDIDVSYLEQLGFAPNVYYSKNNELSSDNLTQPEIWMQWNKDVQLDENERKSIKAIKVEARVDQNGQNVVLDGTKTPIVDIIMQAPTAESIDAYNPDIVYSTSARIGKIAKNIAYLEDHDGNLVPSTCTQVGIEKVTFSGNIYINDEHNHDKKRPSVMGISLFANDEYVTSQNVSLVGGDEYRSFNFFGEELYGSDENGNPIEYSVKISYPEVAGFEYRSIINYGRSNGMNVANIYLSYEPKTRTISGEKKWLNDDSSTRRPTTVGIDLYQDGKLVKKTKTSASQKWKYEFQDAYVYDLSGAEATYSVKEHEYVAGYKTSTHGYDVENSYYPYGNITIENIAVNNSDTAMSLAPAGKYSVLFTEQGDKGDTANPIDSNIEYYIVNAGGERETSSPLTISNGATILIPIGKKAEIVNIPSDIEYLIEQIDISDGWSESKTENNYGVLRAGTTETVSFENSYFANGKFYLDACVELTGKNAIRNGQFQFEITDISPECTEQTIYSGYSSTDGSISFAGISYTNDDIGKDIVLKVTQTSADAPGYTIDREYWVVYATILDDGKGNLVFSDESYEHYNTDGELIDDADEELIDDEPTTNKVIFKNSYVAKGTVPLSAWVSLDSCELKGEDFSFDLVEVANDESSIIQSNKKNDKNGVIALDPIEFVQDAAHDVVGKEVFRYEISQRAPEDDDAFIRDLETVFVYSVKVKDMDNGKLEFDVSFWKKDHVDEDIEAPVFYNTPKDGALRVTKHLSKETDDRTAEHKFKVTFSGTNLKDNNDMDFEHDESDIEAQAFAILDIQKKSLTFHSARNIPTEGESFIGSDGVEYNVSAAFLGFEDSNTEPSWTKNVMIESVETVSAIDNISINLSSMKSWFRGFSQLKTVDLSNVTNNSRIDDVSSMFEGCSSLKEMDLSSLILLGMSEQCRIENLFKNCTSLKTIYVPEGWSHLSSGASYNVLENAPVVGGFGTDNLISNNYSSELYFRIDKGNEHQGVLTPITYVQYHDESGNVQGEPIPYKYGISYEKNLPEGYSGWKLLPGAPSENDELAFFDDEDKQYITYDTNSPFDYIDLYPAGKEQEKHAFAVFDRNGKTLRFYNRPEVPNVGDTMFDGTDVTAIYTSDKFEDVIFNGYAPWGNSNGNAYYVEKVSVVDKGIKPVSIAYWFSMFSNLKECDLSNLNTSRLTNMDGTFSFSRTLTKVVFGNFDASKVTNMSMMFSGCTALKDLDLSGFITEDVENMMQMFNNCSGLTSLDLSGFSTSKVTSMQQMFSGCTGLTKLDLSNFNTDRVSNLNQLFYNCTKLLDLNLSGFNTSSVTQMAQMFYNCSSLKELDLSSFNVTNVTNMMQTFYNCCSIEKIYVSNDDWNTTSVTSYNNIFYQCLSIVGGAGSDWTVLGPYYYTKTYARIDKADAPGFFTAISDKPSSGSNEQSLNNNLFTMPIINAFYGNAMKSEASEHSNIEAEYYRDSDGNATSPIGHLLFDGVEKTAFQTVISPGVINSTIRTYNASDSSLTDYDVSLIFDAYGGTFSDGASQNQIDMNPITGVKKISHSNNMDDKGVLFGNWWENQDPSKTSGIVDVVTIPNAKKLKVTIKYQTSSSYAFVALYDSSVESPYWNADSNNTRLSISGQLYGGSDKSNPNVSEFYVDGDTAKFLFVNYAEKCGYGYHATVEEAFTSDGEYKEPTKKGSKFIGWQDTDSNIVEDWRTVQQSCTLRAIWDDNPIVQGTSGSCKWIIHADGYMTIEPKNGDSGELAAPTRQVTWPEYERYFNAENYSHNTKPYESELSFRQSNIFVPEWWDYRDDVTSVEIISGVALYARTDEKQILFADHQNMISADLSRLDTKKAVNLQDFFSSCVKLETINLSNDFNTANVTNMSRMFYECFALREIIFGDANNFNTSRVTNMNNMFYRCSIEKLELDFFDTSRVTDMSGMFRGCRSNKISCGTWNTSNVTSMSYIFSRSTDRSNFSDYERSIPKLSFDNWDTSQVISMSYMFEDCYFTDDLDISNFNTSNVTIMDGMFKGTRGIDINDCISTFDTKNVVYMAWMFSNTQQKTFDFTSLDLSNVESAHGMFASSSVETITWPESISSAPLRLMGSMFEHCSHLQNANLDKINTLNVIDMSYMFAECGVSELDLSCFSTARVENMEKMFRNCHNLTALNVSGWNTMNVTNMESMFSSCNSLTSLDLSSFNTRNVTSISSLHVLDNYGMFEHCEKMQTLVLGENFTLANVTSMFGMFAYCSALTKLDVSKFNTKNVTDMSSMFANCYSLTDLDLSNFDTGKVTSMNSMFYGCSSLTNLDLNAFNTSNVTSMRGMFCKCLSLETLNISRFDTSKITEGYELNYFLAECNQLSSFTIGPNFKIPAVQDVSYIGLVTPPTSDEFLGVWRSKDAQDRNGLYSGIELLAAIKNDPAYTAGTWKWKTTVVEYMVYFSCGTIDEDSTKIISGSMAPVELESSESYTVPAKTGFYSFGYKVIGYQSSYDNSFYKVGEQVENGFAFGEDKIITLNAVWQKTSNSAKIHDNILEFSLHGEESATFPIPAGTKYVVEELTQTGWEQLSMSGGGVGTIKPNETSSVTVTNAETKHNGTLLPGDNEGEPSYIKVKIAGSVLLDNKYMEDSVVQFYSDDECNNLIVENDVEQSSARTNQKGRFDFDYYMKVISGAESKETIYVKQCLNDSSIKYDERIIGIHISYDTNGFVNIDYQVINETESSNNDINKLEFLNTSKPSSIVINHVFPEAFEILGDEQPVFTYEIITGNGPNDKPIPISITPTSTLEDRTIVLPATDFPVSIRATNVPSGYTVPDIIANGKEVNENGAGLARDTQYDVDVALSYSITGNKQIVVSKELVGASLKGNDFTFELFSRNTEGTSEELIKAQKNDYKGEAIFNIEYAGIPGTVSQYILRENQESDVWKKFVDMDTTEYLIDIEWCDAGNGNATPVMYETVSPDEPMSISIDDTFQFENRIKGRDLSVTKITKNMTTASKKNAIFAYNFFLQEDVSSSSIMKNDGSNTSYEIDYGVLDEATGEHVVQSITNGGVITFDSTNDSGSGKTVVIKNLPIGANYSIVPVDGSIPNGFDNDESINKVSGTVESGTAPIIEMLESKYSSKGEVVFNAMKNAQGFDLKNEQFSFASTVKGLSTSDKSIEAKNSATGEISFPIGIFTDSDDGTEINIDAYEIIENDSSITYDTEHVLASFTISDDGQGNMIADNIDYTYKTIGVENNNPASSIKADSAVPVFVNSMVFALPDTGNIGLVAILAIGIGITSIGVGRRMRKRSRQAIMSNQDQ